MKRLQPVIWMKGTFLSPQHLQTQDRFIESTLQFQLEALNYNAWGFRTLQIDQEALSSGYLSISRASGILPDGLLFDVPESDPPPNPKPLADCFDQDQKVLDVFLAIPHYRDPGLNISIAERDAGTRYLAEVRMMRDENSGLAEKPIQVARKNFRMLVEGESQQDFSAIRAGRVIKTPAGTYQLDPQFIPPLLDITGSDFLVAIARRLVEILAAKSSMLAGTRRQKNLTLADFGTSDIANFWLLYTINSHFPLVQHLFESRRGHPEKLYAAMLSLAGALTTFSLKIHPRDLPLYDHDNLTGCFVDLDEKVRTLLETVVPSNYVSLPLRLIQQSIYATAISEEKYLTNTRMYLSVNFDLGEADIIQRTPYLVKVCSANHIEHLVRQALPGVQLTHVPRPPSAIPVKLNCQYFSLNQSGVAWEAITRARNLAAYVPGELPAPQLELIILLPEAS
ncbi:MAG: type VI secretion system baseplate subunit TssK [Acidobacteria bacterium]|nr:type VI secretion system baseplate subunit TssK [Acidobacteriota bacterium]